MRKVAIALVVVVVLAVLATPLVGGILARRAHAELVARLPQVEASTTGAVRIVDEGFELGWLTSKARMRLEVGPAGSTWTFPLVHVIHHGPFPVGRATRGFSAAVIDTTLDGATLPDGKQPFFGETVIGMTGDVGVDLASLAVPRREELAWEGGTAQIRVADRLTRITAQATAPRFELHGKPGDVVLESVKVDYAAQRQGDGPSIGASTYALGRAQLSTSERSVSIDQLSWKSSTDINSTGKLDSSYALRVAAFDLDDQTYRNVGFDLAFKNLDQAAIQALSEIGRAFSQIGTNPQAAEALASQLQAVVMFQLPALMASSPEVELKGAHVETLDGPIDADLRVMRDTGAGAAAPSSVQVQGKVVIPLSLFAALTLRAAEQISPMAKQSNDTQSLNVIADQIAERLLTRGYVKEEDDGRLSSDLTYRGNELVLNGEPVSLSDLITGGTGSFTP